MTHKQAIAEAARRGSEARVRQFNKIRDRHVSWLNKEGRLIVGFGLTWEAAFADADQKSAFYAERSAFYACGDCGSTGHDTGSDTCPGPDEQ